MYIYMASNTLIKLILEGTLQMLNYVALSVLKVIFIL